MVEIKQIIATTLQIPLESVRDDSSNQSIPEWDSLGHMNLIMALEKHFGVAFTLDEIIELTDLATIQRVISEKKG